MTEKLSPAGMKILPGYDYDRALAWVVPPALEFRVSGPPTVLPGGVELNGVLANASDQELLVIGLPVGTGPFFVEVRQGNGVGFWTADDPARPKFLPPRPAAAPPPPMEFLIPPRSEIVFVGVADLTHLKYQGPLEVQLDWSFLFWNEPKPRGAVKVTLPAR